MSDKLYTVLIVPERSSKVRRLKIPQRALLQAAAGVFSVVALAGFLLVHYLFVLDAAGHNGELKDENVQLKERLRVVQEELARIDGTLQRIDKFSAKVRTITRLNDPERNLAIGPLADKLGEGTPSVMLFPGERVDFEDEQPDSKLALRLIESKIDTVESEALGAERGMRDLHEYFANDVTLLNTTPSIRPLESQLKNSTFGMRRDPYTGQRVMHKGIDYAADMGADIVATADGQVIFAGNRGKYGKTLVIDHGYGLQTHFAHLSDFKVEVGQGIKRGQVLGSAGNTGLTTGVHLHYEVRLNGIPQDPEVYLLD